MEYPKDIEVEMKFLTAEEGGWRTPALSGYRPQFYYEGMDMDAVHTYIDTEQVLPGQTVRTCVAFFAPDLLLIAGRAPNSQSNEITSV